MTTAPPILLTGPTAVGKSAVALRLAEQLGGEIISVDSMQVYRGLDIGTAKPTPAERARVPHHLVDILDLCAPFDAAQFVARAQAAARDIQARGRRPIFCGGTGLYFKAWLEGLGESPAADAALRAELEAVPLPALLTELAAKDPSTYAAIDKCNPRRVVRAVEVIRLTGRPYSEQRAAWGTSPTPAQAELFFALRRAPEDLRARVHRRVEEMFVQGLVEETRQLLTQGLGENRTAMQAIGYRQVVEHLRGERGLDETIAFVKSKTWQYAKRQMTWLRHQASVQWMDWPPETSAAEMANLLARRGGE